MSFPLLGKDNEVVGTFDINIRPQIHFSNNIRSHIFCVNEDNTLVDNDFYKELIDSERATIITSVFCSSTLFKETISGYNNLIIPKNDIGGIVEVSSYLVACSDFTVDLSEEQSINDFFRTTLRVSKGTILSEKIRHSFNLPIKFLGESKSLFNLTWDSNIEEIDIDFEEDVLEAGKVTITFPSQEIHSNIITHLESYPKFDKLATQLFFESILLEMFSLIGEKHKAYKEGSGDDKYFPEVLNQWMQELYKDFKLYEMTSISELIDFNTRFNLLHYNPEGDWLIQHALDQLNIISEGYE